MKLEARWWYPNCIHQKCKPATFKCVLTVNIFSSEKVTVPAAFLIGSSKTTRVFPRSWRDVMTPVAYFFAGIVYIIISILKCFNDRIRVCVHCHFSHHFAASVFRMLLVIRVEGGWRWAWQHGSPHRHARAHDIPIFPVSLRSVRWRARTMSEVSVTKRKEKCENCTKQVNNLPFGSAFGTWRSCTDKTCFIYPFSAARNRVRTVPTRTKRRRKSMDR